MRAIMVIEVNKHSTVHYCSTCGFSGVTEIGEEASVEQIIPTYYSNDHARKHGWRVTSHHDYCPPDLDWCWICPECVIKYGLVREKY